MTQITALQRVLDALATTTGTTARGSGRQHMARCPVHEDKTASLSVTDAADRVLLKCHAGCDNTDILAAINLTFADLYHERRTNANGSRPTVVAEYQYTDEAGKLLYVVERRQPKAFRQKRPDGAGGWVWNMQGVRRVLYRLPVVLDAVKNARTIYVVEGEKDADRLDALGLVATCNVGGASKWRDEYATVLKTADVIVITDMDEPGRAHAATVVASLRKAGARVRLAEPVFGKDITDHLDGGGEITDIEFVEENTAPQEDDSPPTGRHLVAVTADTMTMKAPRWLYDWRIPTGAITLLAGREGIGKSTIGCDTAAMLTRGTLPGRYFGTPKGVAIVASEDAWEEVIVPRLVAAGADRSRIFRVDAYTEDNKPDAVSVPADLERLAKLCADHDIVLVILDPLMSVIHSTLDTHKDREVRQALDPLSRFATRTGIAVLGLIHVNKTSTTDPLTSIMASRAFAAVARSVLYCLLDPDAERDDRYLFGHTKSNLGPKQATLRYHMVGVKLEIEDDDEPVVITSRVIWDGQDDRTVREAMEATGGGKPVGQLATDLEVWITQQGRTVSMKEIISEFSDIKLDTLEASLRRMIKRGTLYRPIRGHYATKQTDASDTSDVRAELSKPTGKPTLPLETQEASEVSEASELPTEPMEPTLPMGTRARRKLASEPETKPMAPWAADAYDRE